MRASSVWDAVGAQVDLKDGALDRDNRKVLAVSLPPLPPGRYTVRYRVLSVDGHVVEASFVFTVGPLARRPWSPAASQVVANGLQPG